MSRVILQPAGSGDASLHYVDTIEHPVAFDRITRHVAVDVANALQEIYGGRNVPVWGVVPGEGGVNQRKWERINAGDIAMFARRGGVFAVATVTLKTHCKPLALDLWKTDRDGDTWEFIYFLDEVRAVDIPYERLNAAAGYKANNRVQGFTVVDEEKSEAILAALDLASDRYLPETSEEEYLRIASSLLTDSPLDAIGKGKVRKEQGFLRHFLFGRRLTGECGICGVELPVELLVAAHIKKRSACTEEEKRDYKNVVMPMCKLGCDDLFEKKYIGVDKGRVVDLEKPRVTAALARAIEVRVGRPCRHWTVGRDQYFAWHRTTA